MISGYQRTLYLFGLFLTLLPSMALRVEAASVEDWTGTNWIGVPDAGSTWGLKFAKSKYETVLLRRGGGTFHLHVTFP